MSGESCGGPDDDSAGIGEEKCGRRDGGDDNTGVSGENCGGPNDDDSAGIGDEK